MDKKIKKKIFLLISTVVITAIVILVTITSFNFHRQNIKSSSPDSYSFSDKVVLAYYYMWYTAVSFATNLELQDVHPTLGAYNSSDPYIIEEHVKMAKQAKIDAFAASWWLDNAPNGMNFRLNTLFEKAALHDLKVTIDLEGDGMAMGTIYENLHYYLSNFSNLPSTLKVDGKPVVLIWGSWNYSPDEWQATFNNLTAEGLPAFYLVSGQTSRAYLGPFRCLEQYVSVDTADSELPILFQNLRAKVNLYNSTYPNNLTQWHATIMPGFDERNIAGRDDPPNVAGWKDRNNGQYYQMTFNAAMSSSPDWLHITSFNELGEHTYIEPTLEYGWYYINKTAELVDQFKQSGASSSFGPPLLIKKVV